MEYSEVTIKQIADECGVSKSTAVRKFKELNLPVVTRGGKGTVYLGPEAASALAHALVKGRTPEAVPQERVPEVITAGEVVQSLNQPQQPSAGNHFRAVEETTVSEPVESDREELIRMYREQIRSLGTTNEVLRNQINQLNVVIEVMRNEHETTIALLSDQIDRLNLQLETMQAEKEKLRDELAMSRALEGFHFPWQRDRIVSRYLLPSSTESTYDAS